MHEVGSPKTRSKHVLPGVHTKRGKTRCCIEDRQELGSEVVRASQENGLVSEGVGGKQAAQIANDRLEELNVLILRRWAVKNLTVV